MRQLLLTVGLLGFASYVFAQNPLIENPYNESPPRYTVALTPDGQLQGWAGYLDRATGELRGTSGALVHLIRDGKVVAHVETQLEGRFEVSGLAPGVYSVVVIDERGFSSSAFQVVGAGQEAAHTSMLCTMVSHDDFQAATGDNEGLALAHGPRCCDGGLAQEGGAGGGGGGGGGGFGGLLGWGLGAAGLGVGIAALADDDGGRQPAASPVLP